MGFLYKRIVLLVVLILINISVFCQFKSKIHIIIKDLNYENGLLSVRYDIENAKENDNIRIWIDIFNSKKDTIRAKSWEGDINKYISGKGEKLAIWNTFKDKLEIVDSLTLKISATVENRFYLTDPYIVSTIYPGLGDYQIRKKGPYWIYGAIGYSFVGASIGMYFNSINNYDMYLNANTINDKNQFYKNALASKKLSYAFLGVAGAVWAIDYLGLIKRKKEIRQLWKKNLPVKENPNIPSFKIVSALSEKIFINTNLTKLKLVEGTAKYIDLDENSCLDAYEEGKLQFVLFNQGPAKAVNFYAKIKNNNRNQDIIFPDSFLISHIPVNQNKLIQIPVKAKKNIESGTISLSVSVSAKYNIPVEPFSLSIKTCKSDYQQSVSENELIADIDSDIPVLAEDGIERFALIIGNEGYSNEYTGLSHNFNVPYARNDALAFKKFAINILGVKERNIILLLDANKKDISNNILVLSDRVKQLKNKAELIFYFAGHGLSDTLTTAPYIMPVDIPPHKLNNAIPIDSLYKKIADSKAIRSMVVLDASFNNGGRTMGLRGPSAKKINFRPEVIPSNTVVFSAVWKQMEIHAYDRMKHGLFTYCFLKTLKNNKGKISYLQLDNQVNAEILSIIRNTTDNRATTTSCSRDISDIWPRWMVRN